MKQARVEPPNEVITKLQADHPEMFRIICREEDILADPSKLTCAGLVEIGTQLQPCSRKAEWWVGEQPSCSECIATFLDDEKPTGVAPIAAQPTPTLDACLYHRCTRHFGVAQINATTEDSECGACVAEDKL